MGIFSNRVLIAAAFLTAVLGLFTSVGMVSASVGTSTLILGLSVAASGFLMIWSMRAGQGFPHTLALLVAAAAILLPELSAESYFAWTSTGADNTQNTSAMFAPMTGAIRLIVGFAWPSLILLAWLKNKGGALKLNRRDGISLSLLFLATLYAFNIYIKGYVSILDSTVLSLIFVVFIWLNGRRGAETRLNKQNIAIAFETESAVTRWLKTMTFGFAAITSLVVSGVFASRLAEIGATLGNEQFVLAQFAMPLASKGVWLALIGALVWKAKSGQATQMLLTTQAGIWTLLIAILPLVTLFHGAAYGQTDVLTLNAHQKSELLLAASQTVFALAILSAMTISWRSAVTMLTLSTAQAAFVALQPDADSTAVQGVFSVIYLVIAAVVVARHRARVQVLSGVINVNLPSGLRRAERKPQPSKSESSMAGAPAVGKRVPI